MPDLFATLSPAAYEWLSGEARQARVSLAAAADAVLRAAEAERWRVRRGRTSRDATVAIPGRSSGEKQD